MTKTKITSVVKQYLMAHPDEAPAYLGCSCWRCDYRWLVPKEELLDEHIEVDRTARCDRCGAYTGLQYKNLNMPRAFAQFALLIDN